MKRFSLLCLLSASLALAACNFNTIIDATITPGSESSTTSGSTTSDSSTNTSETTSSDNSTNSDGTMSSDSTTDTTISPENIEDNFSVKIKTAVGGSWIHLIAEWEDSAFAVKDSDLITLDEYKPVIDNTISFTNLLSGESSSSSKSRTWGVGFEKAEFITEIKHSLVLHMNVNGGLYKITVPFIGKLNTNDEEFDITEEGISFERRGNKLDVPGDNSGNSGNNNPGNSGGGSYENGHGAGAESEQRTPSTQEISKEITGINLVPVTGDNKMVFQFVNSTGGVWKDDEIYIYALCQMASLTPSSANPERLPEDTWCYIDKDGKLHDVGTSSSAKWEIKLSDIKDSGIQMPYMKSGRIFYSYGQPLTLAGTGTGYAAPDIGNPNDPNAKKYFDWLEFTVSDNGTWVNTTQVDQLGFPVLMHLIGKDAGGKPVMATTGLTKKREEIWKLYKEFVPDEFKILASEYRIVAPAKGGLDTNYFDNYVTEVWNHWKDNPTVMHHPKGEFKLSGDGTNLYFECLKSYDNNQMAKEKTTYLISGKPSTREILEGSEKLASPHTPGADGNHVAMELALEAWVCAALNRHVAHLDPDSNWCDMYDAGDGFWRIKAENEPHERQEGYYKDSPCNWYAAFWHTISENNGLAYGFCYDDVNDQSATTYVNKPTNCIVKLGF